MVNEQEEIKLGYLLDPCFELCGTKGAPLTNGWIEVYIHGTRNKYYCYSDFGGTLHPFKIPLDSLGANIVLADPNRAYDVYVYNRFGSLVMSRYNVSPGHAGGAAISSGGNAEHWIGRYGGTIQVAANEYSDSIPLPIEPDYEGTFIDHIFDNKNIVLKDGLYLVDCLLSFRQNPDSLNNTLGYVHVFTGLDDGESGVFQRNETLPDTDPDETHNIRVQFIRHVEGSTGCNVCFQVRTTNAWSFVRIQGLSIVKLGAGGGIAPQPIEYDAGQYISIDNDVISVTGLQPSGNYADAGAVSQGFYGVAQQLSALSGQINEVSGQIPSLDGYATEEYVQSQVSGKADKSEIPSLQGYATEEWVRQQNYLTEVPSQYVTESELNSAISGKADSSEIPSLDGYATEGYVDSAVSGKQDELEFTYDADDKITTIDGHGIAGTGGGGGSGAVYIPGQYISIQNDIISVTGLQPSGEYLTQDDLQGYATDDDVQAAVSGKADKSEIPSLSGYATEDWVGQQGYLTSVPSEYITETDLESELSGKADVSAIPSVAGLASETYVDQTVEAATSGKADVSAIPSLSGYATESWVTQQGYLTEVPAGYATDDDVIAATSGKLDSSAYVAPLNADWSATSGLSQILNKPEQSQLLPGEGIQITPSGADYVISSTGGGSTYTEGDYVSIQNDVISVTGLQPSGEYLVPQDLSGYATQNWVGEQGYLTSVPDGYATDAEVEAATSGKADLSAIANLSAGVGISITASGDGYVISSTGGGSVPEGVMAESGLNYTVGGEISGYNNSAFCDAPLNSFVNQNSGAWGGESLPVSGGPGVKLDMVDNTIVASIDETVLFEGTNASACTLSEAPTNFDRLRLEDRYHNLYEFTPSLGTHNDVKMTNYSGVPQQLFVQFSVTNNMLYVASGFQIQYVSWDPASNSTTVTNKNSTFSREIVMKIVGINRIAGGN